MSRHQHAQRVIICSYHGVDPKTTSACGDLPGLLCLCTLRGVCNLSFYRWLIAPCISTMGEGG